jgi:hypothetical protein
MPTSYVKFSKLEKGAMAQKDRKFFSNISEKISKVFLCEMKHE